MQYEMDSLSNTPSAEALREIDTICDAYEADFGKGVRRDILALAESAPLDCRDLLLYELMLLELELEYGKSWNTLDLKPVFKERYKGYRNVINKVFSTNGGDSSQARKIRIRCPKCRNAVEVEADASFEDIDCQTCGSNFSILDNQDKPSDAPPIASILHFELIERIGVGGFGTVWKAQDTKLDREVAVKIPRKGQLLPEEEEQFLREARAAAQLSHPNIVSVHDIGRDPDADTVFIVSDIVRGIPLSEWLSSGVATESETVAFCIKIADALQHAHEAGVIHRDLKPHNIILDEQYEPFLTDFGLAKREYGEMTVTMDGQLLGTPAYMPPEQAAGNAHLADSRADIYSMGVMLFQLLTGELPFRGNPRMVMHQVLNTDAPSPRTLDSTIPRDLETICLKCLEKSPDGRYQTARELADDLRRYSRNEPIMARPVSSFEKGWRWCQRNKMLAGSIATGLLLLTMLAVGSLLFSKTVSSNRLELANQLTTNLIDGLGLKRKERKEAYRDDVKDDNTFGQIQSLRASNVNKEQLIQLSVSLLGDFVGRRPVVHESFERDIKTFAIHPSGSPVAVLFKDGGIELRDPLVKKPLGNIEVASAGNGYDLRFSSDGQELVGIFESALVKFRSTNGKWAESDRTELKDLELEWAKFSELGQHFIRWNASDLQLRRTTDAEVVLELRAAQMMQDVFEGKQVESMELQAIAYSDVHSKLVICYQLIGKDAESGFIVWDPGSDKPTKRVAVNRGTTYGRSVRFCPAGKTLALGTDQTLELYSLPDFTRRYSGNTGTVKSLAFT
ncbi:MAG: serine/threonine-protein kinase, partial [Planctomycetota bacterium]